MYSIGMFILNVGIFAYGFIEMTNLEISVILVKIFYKMGHYDMQYLLTAPLC
jgi:hypothetical protein